MASTQQKVPPPSMKVSAARSTHFYRLGHTAAHHPWAFIAAWVVVFAAAALLLPRLLQTLTGVPLDVTSSESQQAQALLQRQFARSFTEQDLIVFQSDTSTIQDPAYQQAITGAVQKVSALPGVVGVISPLDPQVSDQVSADRHAAVALVGVRGSDSALQQLAPRITQEAQSAATSSIHVSVTGESEIMADMAAQETRDLALAERIGLPVALLVLLLAFGSLVAAGLPLLLALVGVTVTFGVLGVATFFTRFDLFIETIVTMIGLGVGIDYSMFLVTRYREELARGIPPKEAVAVALATAGKAIFFSGLTVILALSALLLVDMKLFADMAIGAMVAVGITLAVALSLLPAVLGLLGRNVNRLALPGLRRTVVQPDPDRGFWARWVHGIMRRPVLWTIFATLLLLVLAAPVINLNLGLDLGITSLRGRSSGQAVEVLQRYFSPGAVGPIQIVVEDPRGPLTGQDLTVVSRLTTALQQNRDVLQVVSITSALDRAAGNHSATTLAAVERQPQMATDLGYLVNAGQGNNATIISAVSRSATDSNNAMQLVRTIRSTLIPQVTGHAGVTILVGGLTAQIVDMSAEATQKLPLVVGVILLLSFLLLTLVFRSLFLPLKAIIMNALSVLAAYGLLVVVFQQGAGAGVFAFTPVGNVQVYLPLLTFAFLFGLSMDYEVFLIGRMKEEWEQTRVNEVAVARGLQHTARAITSAAAIMVVVFLSFTFTTMLEMKEIGFALAVAVFVDATIIRVLLVPAAMRIMGRWNWWLPRWLDRIIPHVGLAEGRGETTATVLADDRAAVPLT